MNQILWPEWSDEQQSIRYPFVDGATLRNADGITVDPELFLDAAVHPVGGAANAYLGKVTVVGRITTFYIYDPTNGQTCYGVVDPDNPPAQPGVIRLIDAYSRAAGVLVSTQEKLDALDGLYGIGEYEFTQAQTEFTAAVVTPVPNHRVRGLLLDDGTVVAGDVWLVGEDGVVLSIESGMIRVDLVGDPYAKAKACVEEGQPQPDFCGVRTFNEIPPDSLGDFKVSVGGNEASDAAIRLEQEGNTIKLKLIGGSI